MRQQQLADDQQYQRVVLGRHREEAKYGPLLSSAGGSLNDDEPKNDPTDSHRTCFHISQEESADRKSSPEPWFVDTVLYSQKLYVCILVLVWSPWSLGFSRSLCASNNACEMWESYLVVPVKGGTAQQVEAACYKRQDCQQKAKEDCPKLVLQALCRRNKCQHVEAQVQEARVEED